MSTTMTSERYELSWKEFDQCTSQAFKNHFNKEDFSDVTLACDDEKQIKAHKMILSACSPFFQKILLNNPHQYPLIYLKGIKFESLKLILRFMYLGETKVSEEDLQSFLTAAEELKILGLSDSSQFRSQLGASLHSPGGLRDPGELYLQSDHYDSKPVISGIQDTLSVSGSSDNNTLYAEYAAPVSSGISLSGSGKTSSGMKTQQRTSYQQSQTKSQAPVIKKETNTVRCNLCNMLIVNNEKCLLEHVQRMHGA